METARDLLRRVVREHGGVVAAVTASPRGAVLIDLIARADLGVSIVLHALRLADPDVAQFRETIERRYSRRVELAEGYGRDAVVIAEEELSPLEEWSDEDVLAYLQAHGAPSIGTMERPRRLVHERKLAAVGC